MILALTPHRPCYCELFSLSLAMWLLFIRGYKKLHITSIYSKWPCSRGDIILPLCKTSYHYFPITSNSCNIMSPLPHINLGLINFIRIIYFGNIVQLLLLSVTMINAPAALFYMHTVYIYIYLYALCCMCMTIAISLD